MEAQRPSPHRFIWLVCLLALLVLSGCDSGTPPSSASKNSNPAGNNGQAATATAAGTATPLPSPTATPAPTWLTYTDGNYPFSVQYLSNWNLLPDAHLDATSPYKILSFFPGPSQSSAPTLNVISITIGINQPNDTESGPPQGFVPDGTVTVNGTTQTIFSGPGADGGQALSLEYSQGSRIYLFASNAAMVSAAFFKQTFLTMLTSFHAQT